MTTQVKDWSDFEWFIDEYLKKQTIPILRSFADIIQLATGSWLGLKSNERKGEILFRVQNSFRSMKNSNNFNVYQRVRYDCESNGNPVGRPYLNAPAPTFGGVPHANGYGGRYNTSSPSSPAGYRSHQQAGPSRAGSSSGWGRAEASSTLYNRPPAGSMYTLQDWRDNPLWKPVRALSNMETLPDISANENSHTRKERKVHFTLPTEVVEKLSASRSNPSSIPQHSIRLFCTSSDHYKPPGVAWQQANAHIDNKRLPIEYPSVPDVHVDEYPIPFKERGLRGKAGSAPPFDLNRSTRGIMLQPGRMMNVAFAHSGPTTGKKKDQSKRFFFQVVLVEWTPKEELLNKLLRQAPTDVLRSPEQGKKIVAEDDDDIEIGSSNMSLKDPLSYMRITRPIRSTKCTHKQCFDATWWIESNSLHPQWHCPLCNKELRFEDLIVDGFFLEILNTVPDTYDEVLMESSGEWHTPDNKYGSASWIANLPSASVAPTPAPPPGSEPTPAPAELVVKTESPDTKGKRKAIEILSSDDEDDEPLSRPNGHSHPPSSSLPIRPITLRIPSASSLHSRATPINGPPSSRPSAQPSTSDVIDLTLSSDEEEEDEADSETIPGFRRPVDASTSRGVGDSIPRLPSLRHLASGGLSTGNGTGAGWPDEWSWEKELGQLVDSAAPLRNRDPLGAAGYPSYRDGANLNGKRGRGSDSTDEDAADRLRDPDWEDEYGV